MANHAREWQCYSRASNEGMDELRHSHSCRPLLCVGKSQLAQPVCTLAKRPCFLRPAVANGQLWPGSTDIFVQPRPMRRESLTSTSMFMSATRTFRATRAPASGHTRATACSIAEEPGRQGNRTWHRPSGGHRAGPGPRQELARGAQGRGSRRCRSSRTRRCADGTTTGGDLGNAVKTRAA